MKNVCSKITHHSLGDWWINPGAGFKFDTDDYISPPSSLIPSFVNTGPWHSNFYLNIAAAMNIPIGRIVEHFKMYLRETVLVEFFFRVQALPTNRYPDNCYRVDIAGNNILVYRRQAAADLLLPFESNFLGYVPSAWHQIRLTWWQGLDPTNNPCLQIRVETLRGPDWYNEIDYYDTANLWADSAVNRVGISGGALPTSRVRLDDTQIWKEAP